MSARVGRQTFLREAAFGLIVSVVAAALAGALDFVLRPEDAVRLVVAGLAVVSLMRTFGSSTEKAGRVAVLVTWMAATLAAWLLHPSVAVYVLVEVTIVWIVRSLYSYGHLLEAIVDLALSALAISFGVWAGARTESLLLAVWSFFLIQALHVGVPALAARWLAQVPAAVGHEPGNRSFADACAAGEEALRRIAARR